MDMAKTSRSWFWIAAGLVLGLALAAGWMRGMAPRASVGTEPGDDNSDRSPLGALLGRAQRVARLKERIGELRGVWPAMSRYAEEHQGLLPTNVVSLQPYLPPSLANLSDERWEMPSGGMVANPLMQKNDAVLLTQKGIPPGKPKIVVYGDGHIEYKH